MKSRKLFIGFRIPRMAEKHLREYVVSISDLPFRLTKPENFHVTVLFLGFQSEGGISKISEILSELAEELHYDFYTLSRMIRRLTGKNYTELVQNKRITQAAYLLETTGLSVADIGERVGAGLE